MTLQGLSYCADFTRSHDRERYLCALFAPDAAREAIFALLAFNAELASIPEVTREPMMSLIRFAWWREALDEIYARGRVRQHPVVEALRDAVEAHSLSRTYFDRLIAAREADLERESLFDMAALEAYVRETSGTLFALCLQAAWVRDDSLLECANKVGIAYALVGLLRALPHHARFGRIYLPENLLGEEAEDELMEGRFSPELGEGIKQVAGQAELYLTLARAEMKALPREAFFLKQLAWLTSYHLKRLRTFRYDVFALEKKPVSPFLPLRFIVRSLLL